MWPMFAWVTRPSGRRVFRSWSTIASGSRSRRSPTARSPSAPCAQTFVVMGSSTRASSSPPSFGCRPRTRASRTECRARTPAAPNCQPQTFVPRWPRRSVRHPLHWPSRPCWQPPSRCGSGPSSPWSPTPPRCRRAARFRKRCRRQAAERESFHRHAASIGSAGARRTTQFGHSGTAGDRVGALKALRAEAGSSGLGLGTLCIANGAIRQSTPDHPLEGAHRGRFLNP